MKIINNFSKYLDLSAEFTKFFEKNFKQENYENVTLHLVFDEGTQFYDKTEEFPVDATYKDCVLNNFIGSEDTLKHEHIAYDFFREMFEVILNRILKVYEDDKHHYIYLGKIYYDYQYGNKFIVKYFVASSKVDWN
jgi:hypothetical protein